MKVLVCGSRSFDDRELLESTLDGVGEITEIIEGGAYGADRLGRSFGESRSIIVKTYNAEWGVHGKVAGVLRNQTMLDKEKPDLVIAFWDGKSKGTFDMKERAARQGFSVKVVRFESSN